MMLCDMTLFDKIRYTFWTCSGHVPKSLEGQKISFSNKFWRPLGYHLASSAVSKKGSKNLEKICFSKLSKMTAG